MSRLSPTAENIRNIKSEERSYPSDIHVEGVVFDAGRLWLDGHANFLAERHAGLQAALRLEQIELDYFKPITNRYNLSVTHGTLSLAGDIEYAPDVMRVVLGQVLVQGAHLEYFHTPGTALAERARAQRAGQVAKRVTNKRSVELRIDRLDVGKSTLSFANWTAKVPYRVVVSDMNLTLENLSNRPIESTAVARLNGRFMGSGEARLQATVVPRTGGRT